MIVYGRTSGGGVDRGQSPSEVLHEKPGGQEPLVESLSDNKICFEWYCPPVSGQGECRERNRPCLPYSHTP